MMPQEENAITFTTAFVGMMAESFGIAPELISVQHDPETKRSCCWFLSKDGQRFAEITLVPMAHLQTVQHELAHAIAWIKHGAQGHGPVFIETLADVIVDLWSDPIASYDFNVEYVGLREAVNARLARAAQEER